jgi:hypothetical protein
MVLSMCILLFIFVIECDIIVSGGDQLDIDCLFTSALSFGYLIIKSDTVGILFSGLTPPYVCVVQRICIFMAISRALFMINELR